MKQLVLRWALMVIVIVGLTAPPTPVGLAQPQSAPPPRATQLAPAPSPSVTPAAAPASKPDERVEQIFKLLETSDYAAIAPLVKTSFTPDFVALQGEDDLIKYLANYVHRTGGIRRGKIRETGNDAIGFFRSNLTERWGAVMVTVESNPPFRMSSLQIERAKSPKTATPAATPASEKARLTQISNYAAKLAKADLFSGVIAIARND